MNVTSGIGLLRAGVVRVLVLLVLLTGCAEKGPPPEPEVGSIEIRDFGDRICEIYWDRFKEEILDRKCWPESEYGEQQSYTPPEDGFAE